MDPLRIEVTRGPMVESVHRVSAAVVDATGRLVAAAGEPGLITFWRSAAKPFQALPLLEDGVVDRFGLSDDELALACASHSSEPIHRRVAAGFLAKIDATEDQLACGPHPPLGREIEREVIRDRITMTPIWSNCSGKHTGMLALARHHSWPLAGYQRLGHPVQTRLLTSVERWTGLPREEIVCTVDGCTTVCYGLPLRAMATAYARFGGSKESAAALLRRIILDHPQLIAGTRRLCTDLMLAWPGEVFAKVGAEGVYSATIPGHGLGLSIKVEDGDFRSAGIALLAVIRQLLVQFGDPCGGLARLETLGEYAAPTIENTRGEPTGVVRAAGSVRFLDT
ncbi:MAG: asparaginase [Gemmatimonadota bacterium]